MRMVGFTAVGGVGLILGLLAVGCVQSAAGDGKNAFLTFTENFGNSGSSDSNQSGAGPQGPNTPGQFRRTMQVTIANQDVQADLNISMAAWILPGSVRSADQQDTLITGGYVQLSSEVRLGSAFVLPPGTLVYNGPGLAGATNVLVPASRGADANTPATAPNTRQFEFITPDVVLFFQAPPTSCESPAFLFTQDGLLLDDRPAGSGAPSFASTPANERLGIKTLAQIDAYQCSPFRPGLFLKVGGGAKKANEFFEGEAVRINCSRFATRAGIAATVTIGE